MSENAKFVIVGAGHGGVQLAASLRENGFSGAITLIGEEAEMPYHRPPLSKAFMIGDASQGMLLKGEEFYSQNKIDLRLNTRVTKLDIANKIITLANGSCENYDQLALATGSRPRMLPIPGSEGTGVFSLRTASDAISMREAALGNKSVVIIGGGFIGLEVAATLHKRGNQIHLFEISESLMGRSVCSQISTKVLAHYQAIGINMNLGCGVDKVIRDSGAIVGVSCGGKIIDADAVVMAVGGIPDVSLAKDAGLLLDDRTGGIKVNAQMQTSASDIFAIGDSVTFRHPLVGSNVRLESVQNAVDQAKHLAQCICGQKDDYQSMPWFWSDQDSLKLQMAGLPSADALPVLREYGTADKLSVFLLENGVLTGVQTINSPADHLMGRKLIEQRPSPDVDFLKDTERPLKELL